MVMELVDGLDLRTILEKLSRAGQALAIPVALHIAREIAGALDYAHRRTDQAQRSLFVVHGDVTPRNILLSKEGEVKLADFGIARALRALAPGNDLRGGTPGFVAPEADGDGVDHRADIYSLGVTLYVSLGGASPERHSIDVEALRRRRPEITSDLGAIVTRATSPTRDDRYLSAGDLERVLAFELARRHPEFMPSELGALVRAHALTRAPSTGRAGALRSITSAETRTRFVHSTPASAETPGPAGGASPRTRPMGAQPPNRRVAWIASLGAAVCLLVGTRLWSARYATVRSSDGNAVAPAPPRAAIELPSPASTSPPVPARPEKVDAPPKTRASRTRSLTPRAPVGVGYLTVSSVPWGAVYVDGKRMAEQTPVYRLAVPAGRHRVAIFNPKRDAYSVAQVTNVEAGSARVLGFDW
jgi:serine/threonine-protein kinase